MELEERLRKDEEGNWFLNVTDFCLPIFGNIISKAELLCGCSYDKEKDIKRHAGKMLRQLETEKDILFAPEIDITDLYVEFVNGKTVKIWTSEWGGVCEKY